MNVNGRDYISVQFLTENKLVKNPSLFFKLTPDQDKIKIVSSEIYDQILSIKTRLEQLEGKEFEVAPYLISSSDPVVNELNVSKFDFLDFIDGEYFRTNRWVNYNV